MKTRIIYTKFWYDSYISTLTPKEKLLFIYLISNEKVNICGIYELPDRYITLDTGLTQGELDRIKKKFMADGKFTFVDGWVKITNFDTYNSFSGEKNERAKEKELALIPPDIIGYTYPINGVSIDYRYSTDSLNNHNHNHNHNQKKKPDKEKKRHFAEFVTLSLKEYQTLKKQYGKKYTRKFIETLDNAKGAKGYKYKSDYRAIRVWVIKKVTDEEKENHDQPTVKPYKKV